MGKIGKISVIPKDATTAFPTMDTSLRQRNMSRFPGTVKMILPYQEAGGKYRNGLDEDSKEIRSIEDKKERDRRIKEVIDLRKRLEEALGGVDLSPRSSYYTMREVFDDSGRRRINENHIQPYSLKDGDNVFNLDDPYQYVTYLWVKAHPTIASSLEAYNRGDYPAETQFYVNDEELAADIEYKNKKKINDAIVKFNSFSIEKRRKVARLLGLPIGDDSKETVVYNAVDNYLKEKEVKVDHYKGSDPIRIFGLYADLREEDIEVRDTIEKAIQYQIYRIGKSGKVFEGEQEVFADKEQMINYFLDDTHQEDFLALGKKITLKKTQHV